MVATVSFNGVSPRLTCEGLERTAPELGCEQLLCYILGNCFSTDFPEARFNKSSNIIEAIPLWVVR